MHIEPRLWTFTRGVRLRIAWTVLIGLIASALGVARLGLLGWLIGALFAVYGLMLTIAGFFTSDADIAKAADININLWLGLGMLLLGVFFLVWWRVSPMKPPEPNLTGTDRPMPLH